MDKPLEQVEYRGYTINIYQDDMSENPIDDDEGMGNFYHWKDHGKEELEKYCELLGYDIDTRERIGKENPFAVRIDKYEHNGISYSVAGEGTRCRWDTSHTWAVWYPTPCLIEDIKRFKTIKAQRNRCIDLARQACIVFNQWANGEIYGYSIENEDFGGCWGFYGYNFEKSGLLEKAREDIDEHIDEVTKETEEYYKDKTILNI